MTGEQAVIGVKFWQSLVLVCFFRYGAGYLALLSGLRDNASRLVLICVATLLLAAVFVAGNGYARRTMLRVRLPLLGWSLALAVGLWLAGQLTYCLVYLFQPAWNGAFMAGTASMQLLYLVILAPITEEVVVRWGLITGLSQRLPWQAAVLLSAALFAWGHSWFKLPHTLLTGLVLGYLCWYTGAVMYGIVVHILVNGVPDGFFITWQQSLAEGKIAVSGLAGLAGLALTLWALRRMLRCADRLAVA